MNVPGLLRKQWFLGLLFLGVAIAYFVPEPGYWVTKHLNLKYFIYVLLFLTSLTFNTGQLVAGFRAPKPIGLSLLGTYFILPVLFYGGALLLGTETPLGVGLLLMGAAPCSLASSAVWTRLSGGNTPLAVAMIVFSNALNIVAAPVIMKLTMGQSFDQPIGLLIGDLALKVLLPITLGQVAGMGLGKRREAWSGPIGVVSRLMVLCVVTLTTSKAVSQAGEFAHQEGFGAAAAYRLTPGAVALLVLVCVVAHAIVVLLLAGGGRVLGLPLRDRIAAIYVGGQKTLPVPVYYIEQFLPQHGLGVLALVSYHATQLIFDSFLIEYFKAKAKAKTEEESAAPASGET